MNLNCKQKLRCFSEDKNFTKKAAESGPRNGKVDPWIANSNLEINPIQKELLPSGKLQDHAHE